MRLGKNPITKGDFASALDDFKREQDQNRAMMKSPIMDKPMTGDTGFNVRQSSNILGQMIGARMLGVRKKTIPQ